MSNVKRAIIGMFKKFFIDATGVDVLATCKNSSAAADAYLLFLDEVGKVKGKIFQKYDAKRVR
jgi:hypothetical protein